MADEVELNLDPEALKRVLRQHRQGDILDVARLTWLFSPDQPTWPGETEGVEAAEPVMSQSRLSETGLAVVVSQTCDLWQLPDIEPFVLIAQLAPVSADVYADASRSHSVRYFAYPEVPGHGEYEKVALDARMIMPLEKTALLSDHIDHIECPLSDPRRSELSFFLGQRLGRPAFPDEIVDELLGPIEKAFKRVRQNEAFAPFFNAVIWTGLSWTPGKSHVSVLVLTSASRRERHNVGEQEIEAARNRVRSALDHWLRESPYDATIDIKDADEATAIEVLSHHALLLDLEAAQVD